MTKAAAKTGIGPTTIVAIEQLFPPQQRIIEDNLAQELLPINIRIFLRALRLTSLRNWMLGQTEKTIPGLWSGMVTRKRYIDEALIEALPNVNTVVNLGAGFDTRAMRYANTFPDTTFYEVDQREIIVPKEKRLTELMGDIPENVKLLEIDFNKDKISETLSKAGFVADLPTFYIWEAVSQYLPMSAITATFDFFKHAASGCKLALTYVRANFISGEEKYGQEVGYKKFVVKDKLWLSGFEPDQLATKLGEYGWRVVEDLDGAGLGTKYLSVNERSLATTPVERVVLAEKQSATN